MIDKAPDAYRTISEVAEELDLPQHVLRFWETRFTQIKPLKRGGGRRYYRPDDVELLKGIRHLLYAEGYTIKGVQRILKEQGPKAVQALIPQGVDDEDDPADEAPAYAAAPPQAPLHRPPVAVAPQQSASAPPAAQPHWAAPPVAAPAAPPQPAPDFYAWREPPPVEADLYTPQAYVPPPQAQPQQGYLPPQPVPQSPPVHSPAAYPQQEIFAAPAAPPLAPQAQMPQQGYAPPPPPVPPQSRPAGPTAFMRGGLARTSTPVAAPSPAEPAPQPSTQFGFSVRRTITPVPPQAEPEPVVNHRYSPLVEPDLAEETQPSPPQGLSADSRRALQSALFELTECRRQIERIIAGRDR